MVIVTVQYNRKMRLKLSVAGVAVWGLLLLGPGGSLAIPQEPVESIYTDLDAGSCKKEIDKNDPNETPYLVCPGVGGYALIVRRVESGRQSIDIVDPSRRVFPLDYHEFVTRHMSSLRGRAEWRVATKDGKKIPIGLIVRVQAREDARNPAKVTRTYIAVAKVTPNEACVTHRIPAGTRSAAKVRRTADLAQKQKCAPPQPGIADK